MVGRRPLEANIPGSNPGSATTKFPGSKVINWDMGKKYQNKLIILRGNSGSGKSTVAKALRDQSTSTNKIALVEQDYLRRIVLKEKEKNSEDNIILIKQTVEFALSYGYDVILEGIFFSVRYGKMLKRLLNHTPNHFIYYFDISLEETLRRHTSKPNSNEFGEKELKSWYRKRDLLTVENEKIIEESSSFVDTVKRILNETGI